LLIHFANAGCKKAAGSGATGRIDSNESGLLVE
jgi:hypothetical protein